MWSQRQRPTCARTRFTPSKLPVTTPFIQLRHGKLARARVGRPSIQASPNPYPSTKSTFNTHSCRARRKRQRLT
jgi:hypothetical protein